MDFYALYPCTITDLEAVKAAEKKENVYCEHLKERIRANNEEELDGEFFRGITRINLGAVTVSIPVEQPSCSQEGFAFLSVHEQTKAAMVAIVIQDLHIPGLLLNNYFAGDCLTVGNGEAGVPVKEWMEKQNAQAYGTPKSLIISYEEIPKEEVIQYLACEASPIGTINGTVLHQWSQENIAQYDMATAYASDRCLLEITPKVDRDRIARLDQEAVELFFLELLIMQEAAISRVSYRVYELFHDGAFRETGKKIQTKLYDLNLEAANAVLFVNYKKLRYPVTRLSARHIGERFGVAEELEHYQNCRALLEQMIAINTAEEEKIDGDLMSLLLLFLTMVQMVPLMASLVRYLMKGIFSDTDLLATASGAMICLALYGIYWLTSRRALRRQRILREQDYKGV